MTAVDRRERRAWDPRSFLLSGADEPGRTVTPPWAPGWRRSGLIGIATGLVSAAAVLVPVVLAWRAVPADGSTTSDAVAVGASLWLLGGGARLSADAGTVAFTPLLVLGLLVVVARLGVREAMVQVSAEGEHWAGVLPRPLAAAVGSWWAGYAAVVAVAWALAADGVVPPHAWSVALPAAAVPLLAAWLALRSVGRDDPDVLGPRLTPRIPEALRRGVAAGMAGAWLVVAVGALVVVGAVALSWPQVQAVRADLGVEVGGGALLDGLQVAILPNLAVWVVSFLAGPGFSVVEGASVTWGGVESGLLPMVPVLAALPQPTALPAGVAVASLAVVVACGAWVGSRALRSVARLSRLRTKLAVAVAACATTAFVLTVLDAVAGGSLGQFRLASVGAPALLLGCTLFGELLLGAVVAVLRDAWRLRR